MINAPVRGESRGFYKKIKNFKKITSPYSIGDVVVKTNQSFLLIEAIIIINLKRYNNETSKLAKYVNAAA